MTGNRGRRARDPEIIQIRTALAGDLQNVTETLGGDQSGAGALALQQSVGSYRGAVNEIADICR